jgi:hypothetical protein
MNFKRRTALATLYTVLVCGLVFLSCQDFIIERAASVYFPLNEGDWWLYSRSDLYDPMTVLVEVEALDTLIGVECYPVNYSDVTRYYAKDSRGISEYIRVNHTFSGNDYTIAQGFVRRLELPLVKGHAFSDSVFGSLDISGDLVYAVHRIDGFVSEYEDDDLYGSIYKVVLNAVTSIEFEDSTIQNSRQVEEYYAPNIGLVRFDMDEGSYRLLDFEVD